MGPDGEDLLAALEAGLNDSDPTARSQALASRGVYLPRLLRRIEPTGSLSPLEPDLSFPKAAQSFLAPIVESLIKALGAKDSRRIRALVALGLYPGEAPLSALERESKKPEVGLLVAESLARQGGPGAARVLTEMILGVQTPFRAAQVAQLRFVPSPQGTELVKRSIRKGDQGMVVAGAIALEGVTGPDVGELARAASQRFPDGWGALQALESLRRLGRVEHADFVIQLVEKTDLALVKAVGLRVLGYLRCDDVVGFLLGSFRMLAEPLRPYALESLVLAGAPEQDVRPLLEGLVSSPKLALALPAVKAMLAFDPDLAVGLISQILARPEPVARYIGAQCLAFVHTEASREQLAVMVREDTSVPVRVQALMALSQLTAVPGAAEAAGEALADPSPEVRRAAARVLPGLPSGATIAPELMRLLEEGFAGEPESAALGAWARAIAAHAGPDVLNDRVRSFAKSDPLRATFLVRAADPGGSGIAARTQIARDSDNPALKAELYLAMVCAGEAWGAEELGRLIATGSEREAIEACAAVERLGMLLPTARGLTRLVGLVGRVESKASSDDLPEELTTTSRLKALAGGDRGLDQVLQERARAAPRRTGTRAAVGPGAGPGSAAGMPRPVGSTSSQRVPPPSAPRPKLEIQAIPTEDKDEGVEGLSPYTSHSLKQRERPPAKPGMGAQLKAARDQLGWLGIAWVVGLLLLFGHILLQVAGMPGVSSVVSSLSSGGGGSGVLQVERKTGVVQLERGGSATELKPAAELPAQGEAVITGQGSRVALKLGTKESRLVLGERGHISLTRVSVSPDRIEIADVKGALLIDARAGDPTLSLHLQNTTVTVSDAKLLYVNDNLYVGRGKVSLKSPETELTVPTGERVQLDAQGRPTPPMSFSISGFEWEPN